MLKVREEGRGVEAPGGDTGIVVLSSPQLQTPPGVSTGFLQELDTYPSEDAHTNWSRKITLPFLLQVDIPFVE